jgi:inner membrane protein
MDPITHGVIGLAISTFSGTVPSLDNPVAVGAALGAMIPDSDVVIRLFTNEMTYLKHHRGWSHSLPALTLFSAAITLGLSVLMPGSLSFQVFFWTLMGALSHTIFDILNSYGAMLFKQKRKLNLLTLYDPFITMLAVYLIISGDKTFLQYASVILLFAAYLALRWKMKQIAGTHVKTAISEQYEFKRVTILPSLKAFYKWDFVADTRSHHIVGKYNLFTGKLQIIKKYYKKDSNHLSAFDRSNLGKYFKKFSPNIHLEVHEHANHIELKAIDMRYYMKNTFLHHGTLYLDRNGRITESYFHPYKQNKWIPVFEG